MPSRRINLVGREECWTSSTEHRVSFLLKSDNIYSQRTCILQQVDKELRPITKRILTNRKDRDFALRKEVVCKKSKSNVGKKFLLLLPSILRRDLISKCQNEPQANNFGIEKTLARVIENNWWSRMESSVGAYLFSCILLFLLEPLLDFWIPFYLLTIRDHLNRSSRPVAGNSIWKSSYFICDWLSHQMGEECLLYQVRLF